MIDKKAIKKLYKATPTPMGIFQIRNLINGKIFIGSSMNLPGRKNRFDLDFTMGTMMDHVLLKDFQDHGKDNFTFEILDNLEPKEDPAYNYKDDLKTLEELWIEKLQPFDERGYNKKENEVSLDDYSITYRIHALERMFERNITCSELANIIKHGQLVENYPNNIPYPSRLVLGKANSRPLHVVYTFNESEKSAIVVTVYEPDPAKWERNLVRR